ncbi:unnamed protein product [Gordionus sp. m RMFG-2023]|uniref:uncharacterized protein LOC135923946 n=1 Tax=Gordionus sp. m RMFG-2023 TaxID=3053472 RepID=UPI0030DE4178
MIENDFSESSDEDYIPQPEDNDLSEEAEDDILEDETEDNNSVLINKTKRCKRKRNSKTTKSNILINRSLNLIEDKNDIDKLNKNKLPNELWSNFLNCVNKEASYVKKNVESNTTCDLKKLDNATKIMAPSSTSVSENLSDLPTNNASNSSTTTPAIHKSLFNDLPQTTENKLRTSSSSIILKNGSKTGNNISLDKLSQFSGNKRKSKSSILKMTQKSWEEFQTTAGGLHKPGSTDNSQLEDNVESELFRKDLDSFAKGKDSYVDRMSFLNRAEIRQYEAQKKLRYKPS